MSRRHRPPADEPSVTEFPLSFFACPNPECADFNHFDAGKPLPNAWKPGNEEAPAWGGLEVLADAHGAQAGKGLPSSKGGSP